MATHSSILAWKIPWTKEPGGLVRRVAKSQTRLSKHTWILSDWSVVVIWLRKYTEEPKMTRVEFLLLFIPQEKRLSGRWGNMLRNTQPGKLSSGRFWSCFLEGFCLLSELCPTPCFRSECLCPFFPTRFQSRWPPPWTPCGCWWMMPTWPPGRMRASLQTACPRRMPPSSSAASAGRSWWTLSYKASNGSRTSMARTSRSPRSARRGRCLHTEVPTLPTTQKGKVWWAGFKSPKIVSTPLVPPGVFCWLSSQFKKCLSERCLGAESLLFFLFIFVFIGVQLVYNVELVSGIQQKGCCCLVDKSCLTLCDPMVYSPPGSSDHGIFPGKNTGAVCHFLL